MRTFQSLLTVYCRIQGEKKTGGSIVRASHFSWKAMKSTRTIVMMMMTMMMTASGEAHENVEKNNRLRLICTFSMRRKKKPSRDGASCVEESRGGKNFTDDTHLTSSSAIVVLPGCYTRLPKNKAQRGMFHVSVAK